MPNNKSIQLLGVKIQNIKLADLVGLIDRFKMAAGCRQIVTANPEILVRAERDKDYRRVLELADLVIADGFGIQLGAFWTGQTIPDRIAGVDLITELIKARQKIFFLGGQGETARWATDKIQAQYPQAKIVGYDDGGVINQQSIPQKQALVEKINRSGAEILVVAFGAPGQDQFIHYWKKQLKVSVAIGAGGTLDYFAGVAQRALKIWRQLGLEWLYRLLRQPWRLRRILTALLVFSGLILRYGKNGSGSY